MKSKTSFFNKTVFFKILTSYWPIWALYLVIWVFILPVSLSNELSWSSMSITDINRFLLETAGIGGVICAILFSFAAAAAVFSFMYTSKSTNFFASLPIRREGLFLTSYLSGITWFAVSNIIVVVLTLLVQTTHLMFDLYGVLCWFSITTLQMIVFYGIATLCASVAGNIWGFGLLYAALNCVPILCESLVKLIGTLILRGLSFSETFLTRYITPAMQLWRQVYTEYNDNGQLVLLEYHGWTKLIIWTSVGLVLAGIGLALYRKRHMETSSDLISVKPLRPVVKYCATAVCSLALGLLIFEIVFINVSSKNIAVPLTICLLIGAFVGYFASSMMLAKSFRVFRHWKGFAVSALVIILLMTVTKLDIFNIEGYIPTAENVESVTVYYEGDGKNVFTDSDDISAVLDIHSTILNDDIAVNPSFGTWDQRFTIKYNLKNNCTVEREYYIVIQDTEASIFKQLDSLLNSGEAIVDRVVGDTPVNERTIYYSGINSYNYMTDESNFVDLTSAEAFDLYRNAILPDMMDGKLGYANIGYLKPSSNGAYECNIIFEILYINDSGKEMSTVISLNITDASLQTAKALKKYGIFIDSSNMDNTNDTAITGGADVPTEGIFKQAPTVAVQ